MANNFCAGCGTQLMPGAKFCPTCGRATALPQTPIQTSITPPQPITPPVEPSVTTPVKQFNDSIETPAVQRSYSESTTPPEAVLAQPAPVYNAPTPSYVSVQQPVYQQKSLDYEIFGENLPAVKIKLDPGDSIFTQSGGLAWMDSGISMVTNMQGGLLKGLGRMVSGESLFMATYTSNAQNQEIVVASTYPGSIAAIDISGVNIIAQKTAFLCAQPSVTLSVYVNKSIGSGLFGGEGFILQRLSGAGSVFLEIDGSCVERILAPGEKIKVDTGNVAAFEESVTYQAEMVKGFKNILFGGEGLFLTTLTGPGKIWLQTMPMPGFAKKLIPYLPKPSPN